MGSPLYSFPLERYISKERFETIRRFSEDKETPCLILDISVLRAKYLELTRCLPYGQVYYAVKANPHDEVIKELARLGSNFDVATRFELDQLLRLEVPPERMSFGNTIKKLKDIAYFYEKGVRLFVTDCEDDLRNLAAAAPGSRVFFRILTEGAGADWPLSRKFGSNPDIAERLIPLARDLGLVPFGVSFHVGSQQRMVDQWDVALSHCARIFASARKSGIELSMINLGGGLPADYIEATPTIPDYAERITSYLKKHFGAAVPTIFLEPGRSLAGDCGIIVSEIIQISKKAISGDNRWVFLDIGKFGGLIETLDEALKYPILFEGSGAEERVVIAGPTCDSMDILYEEYLYPMPSDAASGSRVYIFTTGAYTQSYSSVYFNGFPPLAAYVLPNPY